MSDYSFPRSRVGMHTQPLLLPHHSPPLPRWSMGASTLKRIEDYEFESPGKLLEDFWNEVELILTEDQEA